MSAGLSRRRPLLRRGSFVALGVAVVLQLVILYSPSSGGAPPFPNFDKLVHCTVFALPVFFALVGRLRFAPVVALAAAHAVVSELIQWSLLPRRSGDPWDVVADLVGVSVGVLAARFVLARSGRREHAGRARDHAASR